jgi:hypothetical protein
MIEAAIDFASSETKSAQMIGCLVIGFYADGACNRTMHRPSVRENRMGRDMFDAWAKQSVSAALAHNMAHDVAADVVNRSNGYIDDGDPAA